MTLFGVEPGLHVGSPMSKFGDGDHAGAKMAGHESTVKLGDIDLGTGAEGFAKLAKIKSDMGSDPNMTIKLGNGTTVKAGSEAGRAEIIKSELMLKNPDMSPDMASKAAQKAVSAKTAAKSSGDTNTTTTKAAASKPATAKTKDWDSSGSKPGPKQEFRGHRGNGSHR